MIDQERISPYNINTISTRKVMRVRININLGIISWSNIKKIILQTNIMRIVWQTVRRITNAILAVRGLKRLLRDERKRTKPLWCPRKATYLWWCIQSRTLGQVSLLFGNQKHSVWLCLIISYVIWLWRQECVLLVRTETLSLIFFLISLKYGPIKTQVPNTWKTNKTVRWC